MNALLGVVHYALFPAASAGTGDISPTLAQLLVDDDLGAVEVTWIQDNNLRKQVAEMLGYSGVQVMFSAGPPLLSSGLSLCSTRKSEREEAVTFAKSLLDMACDLGARNFLVGTGPDPGEAYREAAEDAFIESMKDLCEYAEKKAGQGDPLTVCLEPFDRAIHWRQLHGPITSSAEAIREVRKKYPNCGLTIDMSHLAQLGENMEEAIANAGDTVVHAHVANCVLQVNHPLYGDLHPHFRVRDGVFGPNDIVRFLKALKLNGFFDRACPYGQQVVSLEVKPQPFEHPLVVLAACKRLMKRAIDSLRRSDA